MEPPKRILIVDDHRMFREGLNYLISQIPGYVVVGEAKDGLMFLKMIEEVEAEIALVDIAMPLLDGIQATSEALRKKPDLRIIILTMLCSINEYHYLLKAGVSGLILKESGKEELIKALDAASSGETYLSQKFLQKLIVGTDSKIDQLNGRNLSLKLSHEENEVLKLLCMGVSIAGISEQMSISIRMVEQYKSELLQKTGSRNQAHLAVYAIRNHLVNF